MKSRFASFQSADDIEAVEEIVCLAMTIRAAMELDVFTQLAGGPLTPEEVASILKVDAWRLGRLMYCLIHAGLVTEADGRFSNTEIANRCLVKGGSEYMGSIHELWSDLWRAMLGTTESVRKGKPAALHDFTHMTDDELGAMLRGLHAGAIRAGRALARKLDFSRFGNFLDAGGGSGGVAVGVCNELGGIKATIADLPRVAKIARKFVVDEGLEDRILVESVDLGADAPAGSYDVAMLRALLQTVAPETAKRIIANIGESIQPGGEIHVVGRVLEDNRIHPATSVIFDMIYMNIYEGGAAHTFSEHKEWLEAAGFGSVTMQDGPVGSKIVTAVKK